MSKRSWAIVAAGTLWFGLIAGQGCPGFYKQEVASDNTAGSGGGDPSGNTGSGGSSAGGGTGAPTSVVNVEIDNARFTPKSVTISTGQAVRWTNHEFTPHAVRSGNPEDDDKGELFRSGSLGIGATFQHTFTEPGTYYYHCEYSYRLAGMRDATVIVTGNPTN